MGWRQKSDMVALFSAKEAFRTLKAMISDSDLIDEAFQAQKQEIK